MSHKTYDTLWRDTQNELAETLIEEPTQVDSREHRQQLAILYLRYIKIANALSECCTKIVQPQKRKLIMKILEATLGRIIELKSDLVEADLNEYTHCGSALQLLGLTPLDIELEIPKCFRDDRQDELDYKNGTILSVLTKLGYMDKQEVKIRLTEHQAILIIQTHEKARQGRMRAQFMREIKNMKEKSKPAGADENLVQKLGLNAVLRIQKVWRGYITRRNTRRRKLQEMLLIGMIPPPKKDSKHIQSVLENEDETRNMQKIYLKQMQDAVDKCKENLEKNQRSVVLEQLSDEVRNWLYEYRQETGKIPEYTGSERSASRILMSRQGTESEISKSSSKESKKSKTTPTKEGKEKELIKNVDDEEEDIVKNSVSVFIPELTNLRDEYEEKWKNKNELNNPKQHHYMDLIEQEAMSEMENELRKIVDEMMRNELQLLQEALDRDRGHKARKPKKSSKVKRSGKKSKKKKEKDLTPDRTTESLFEELIANGIIKMCPKIYLNDFIGERSYHYPVPHNQGSDPRIAVGDLRQIVTEYCILPLLSQQLHENTPHIKSILLTGSIGSGKDMLVHAICNEAGATLFDITPANIVGKYPGKSGLIMLIHLITKVARLMQPSIIFMDQAERPFVKKIPKSDKTDPKRLKKDLAKIVRNFQPEDRIMLIGCSNNPWEADQKLLQQVYEKFLIIPKPEYGTRYALWSHILGQCNAVNWQFDYSGITKISDGYSIGSIVSAVKEIMTVKRKLQLRVKQLSVFELINALAKRVPIYKEEEEALWTWWSKTPMVKRRQRAIELLIQKKEEQKVKQNETKRKK